MKKRSLADRLQAWQAEAEVPRATPAHQEEEEEADYMSDAFLADMEKTDAPRQLTYAEQRHKTLMEHAEHQRREMEEANERRSKRQRGPLAGEEEARQLGMATNVIERAAADHDQEAPSPGSGTSAALRMMLAMGYQPGTALGRTNMDAHHAPIAPDQRWLGHAGEAGPRRLGIGHAALSQRIADAAASAERVPVDPETQAMQYRVRKSQDAAQRHTEAMLRKARQICRELDEEAGIEEHALHQDTFLRENERGTDDALQLLTVALAEEPTTSEMSRAERTGVEAEAGTETDAVSAPAPAMQRRVDAERFCALPAAARLAVTHEELRHVYAFCIYCGHRYTDYHELLAGCPGESEEAHG